MVNTLQEISQISQKSDKEVMKLTLEINDVKTKFETTKY